MAAEYNWRAELTIASGGDLGGLSHGVTPAAQEDWQTATAGGQMSPGQYTYWYRDSNTMWMGQFQDVMSSRVAVRVTQTWTTSVDNQNNLTVTVSTTVDSIDRDDIRHPAGYYDSDTPGRKIDLYKADNTLVFSTNDYQVATAHNISGSISLGSETFTIAPGDTGDVRPSLHLHNQVIGISSWDDIWLGIQFRNPLPKDYRPGCTLDTNTHIWKSHNRTNGACHVLSNVDNMTWQEMRTFGAPTALGNPPSIYHDNKWYNQLKLGKS